MKKILPIIFFLFSFLTAYAQSNLWYITRGGQGIGSGGDESWGVDVDSLGNVYWATCEKPPSAAYSNIKLYKIAPKSQQIWESNSFGGQWNEKAFIAAVKSPNVYVAGRQDTGWWVSTANALVLAYDLNNGKQLWQYTWDQGYGYEEIDGLVPQSDGIYLSGWTTGSSTSNDFLIQKIDYSGKLIWSRTWGTPMWDDANGHAVMDANNIYIAGRDSGSGMLSLDGNAVLTCFSRTNGTLQWKRSWGGNSFDDYFGLTMSQDSLLYGVGITLSYGSGSQVFINKYTRSGDLIWSRLWGGSGAESARAIIADGDSIIYVAGKTNSYGAGDNDIFLLKYDSSGTLLSFRTWGGAGYDAAHDMVMYGDYVYLCGETANYGTINSQNDALLLKVNGRIMQFPDSTMTNVYAIRNDQNFQLLQNYPNPFNPSTTIRFSLPQREQVTLKVFDVLGREVATLVDGELSAGEHSVVYNTKQLSSGVYFYRLRAGNFVQQKKMEMVK